MSKTTFEFENGKYCIVRDDTTFATEVFRNGEPWDRSLVGDKMIHAMLNEIESLRQGLVDIAQIEFEMYGGDWEEIEQAQEIACTALKGYSQ